MTATPRAVSATATPAEVTRATGVATVYVQNGSDRVPCKIEVAASAPLASSTAGNILEPGAWARISGLVTADKIFAWTSGAAGDTAALLIMEA